MRGKNALAQLSVRRTERGPGPGRASGRVTAPCRRHRRPAAGLRARDPSLQRTFYDLRHHHPTPNQHQPPTHSLPPVTGKFVLSTKATSNYLITFLSNKIDLVAQIDKHPNGVGPEVSDSS